MTTTRRSTLSRPFSRRNKTQQPTEKRRRLFFESLEDRRLLTVSAMFAGDTLTVELNAANDHAFIDYASGNIRVGTTNGGSDVYAGADTIANLVIQDAAINASQQVTFSGGNTITATAGGSLTTVSVTGIETANVDQLIDVTTISGNAASVNVESPGRIQHGINLAADGGTVEVAAGAYNENVNVPPGASGLNLLGANTGISANPVHLAVRGAESIINGNVLVGVSQGASNITVDGFTVNSGSSDAVAVRGPGMTVANNILEGLVAFPTSGTASGIRISDSAPVGPGLSFDFENNYISGYRYGMLLDGGASSYDASAVSSSASGNYLTNNERAIQSQSSMHGGTIVHEISDNTITANDRGIRLAGGQFTISGNVISNNTQYGIEAGVSSIVLDDLTIEDNVITGTGGGDGIILVSQVNPSSNVTIRDTTNSGYDNGGSITNVATVNWETTANDDTLTVQGGTSQFSATGAKTFDPISFSGVTTLNVDTLGGDDTVTVAPHATTVIDLDGGPHSSGDTLIYVSDGVNAFNFGSSTITTSTKADIDYVNFETTQVAGNLVLNGTGLDDLLVINASNSNSGTYQLTSGGVPGPIVAFSGITSLTFNAGDGYDILRINNPAGGVFAPNGGVIYDGGPNSTTSGDNPGPGDSLEILGGSATSVEHRLLTASSGEVQYDGSTGTDKISYTGLEPVLDTVVAVARTFSFLGAGEIITLSNATAGGQSLIDSTLSESITFANPTTSLTIDTMGTGGGDTINIQGVDGAFNAALTITAKTTDAVTFQTAATNIGSGVLTTTAGSIAVNANVTTSGNASLTASTTNIGGSGTLAAGVLTANAVSGIQLNTDVASITAAVSGAGAVSIVEADGVILTSVTTANGPITVLAGGGVLATSVVSSTDNDANDISITASTGNISVGAINAGTAAGDVTLTASGGSILDASNDSVTDVTGDVLTLTATAGIGAAGNSLDIRGNNLTASVSGAGSIDLSEFDGIVLDSVTTADGSITILAAGTVDVISVVSTTDDDANDIMIWTTSGNLQVDSITAGSGAAADVWLQADAGGITDANGNGSLNILADELWASAATGIDLDTEVNSIMAMTTGAGDIVFRETDGVTLAGLMTANGDVLVTANETIGAVEVWAGGSGNASILATGGDIEVGAIAAIGDRVHLEATGAIIDANGAANNVTALELTMIAGASIAESADPLNTTVSYLAATTVGAAPLAVMAMAFEAAMSEADGVFVHNTGGLTIDDLGELTPSGFFPQVTGVTAVGDIEIEASSPLTVAADVISDQGHVVLTAADSAGAGDDLTVNAGVTVQSTASRVELRAGDNMTLEDSSTVRAATKIALHGDYGNADAGVGSTMRLWGTLDADGIVGNITVEGDSDNDTIILKPGFGHTADGMMMDGKDGGDTYIVWMGRLNGGDDAVLIDDSGTAGIDRAEVHGTDIGEEFTVHNLGSVGGDDQSGGIVNNTTLAEQVVYTGTLERLFVFGENEDAADDPTFDTFFVQPSQTTEISINGNLPTWGPGPNDAPQIDGDILDFNSFDNTFLIICGTIFTDDQDGPPSRYQPVHYRSIENMPLRPLGTSDPLRFDMDSTAAETQTDYTSVLPSTVYDASGTPGTRFGWDAVMNGFDRGAGPFSSSFTDLLRDGHWHSASRTFTADVANGWYLVSVKTGDKSFARDKLQVTHGDTGQILMDSVSSPAGEIAEHTFVMLVEDGTLDLTFANMGGDPYWVVNSIEIRPGEILTFGSPETDIPLIADGVTETTILGYNATPNALITIDPKLDTQGDYLPETTLTIVEPDADPDVAGHQVVANGDGVFSYTIVRPSVAGTLRVRYAEVTGEQVSCLSVDFVAPANRRFDFNSGASPTQTLAAANGQDPLHPGYVGVLPTELTSPAVGYGWVTPVSGFDRGALASPDYSDLLRDGAWGSGSRDFRIQLPAGQTYEVTVTFGDASFARDQMNVAVVTGAGAGLTGVATAAGQQVHRTFTATPDSEGELVLRFSDSGGDPYWTVSAVEVRPAAAAVGVNLVPTGGVPALADGETVDVVTVTISADSTPRPQGTTDPVYVYTVSSDAGTIVTAGGAPITDADPNYDGVQIAVEVPPAGTSFQFGLLRPTAATTATVTVAEVNGATRGSDSQAYLFDTLRQFDFNGSGVDTETAGGTWWSVRGGDLYDSAVGHGWNAAVSEFQRNATGISKPQLDSLYRDGHWQSGTRTFQVGVDPATTYNVRIHTGDRSFARNQLQITVEGAGTQSNIATAANEFKEIEFSGAADVNSDGVIEITIANLGGDPYWTINGVEVAESTTGLPVLPEPDPDPQSESLRFDFNTASSATQPPFTGVGATNVYDPLLGYGWQTNAATFNRGIANDLLRDGHWGTSNTFRVNVPDGNYVVNVTLGDASFARNNISIWAEDVEMLTGLSTAAGQFIHRSFPVTVADGQLNVQIINCGGDPYFTINALEVIAAAQGDHGLTSGDGITFAGTSTAVDGSLVTVATSLGSIATADADPSYAGVQVVVTGGAFSFVVTPPAGGGSATVTSEEVTGLAAGTTNYVYAVPAVRRFDFNGSANDTQGAIAPSPVPFQGVRGNKLYTATDGYGWTSTVSEFQRGTTGYSIDLGSVPLYRDGHWGSAARTFQVAVDQDTSYNVRVYVGDRSFARNLIQVTVEGAAPQIIPPTTTNEFVAVTFGGVSTDDGILTVTIVNTGGDPYWVINGLDIWESTATDPGEAPLLAGLSSNEMVGGRLTDQMLAAVVPAAREYWVSTGLADWQAVQLHRTPIAIGDLSYRGALGVSKPEGIWLDASGAGLGWSVGSGQWAVVSGSQTTANGQLTTAAYDLLTVVTHELGHVLGYDDLDPQQHPDHIMAGVLQPGASRIATPAVDSGLTWTFGESASLLSVDRAGRQPAAITDRAVQRVAVDRALDDLLRDDLRVSRDAWQRDEDEEFERLLTSRGDERHDETDDFFAQL